MIDLSRLALPLLAGAALSALTACGEPAAPPAAIDSAPETATTAETQADEHDHVEDDHDHEVEDDHDHDHDEDHAGGTAHVHGIADLAFVIEGGRLSAEMISPLANFGLSESEGAFSSEVTEALPGLISISGGDCVPDAPEAEVDTSSGHTDGHVEFSWVCANPANIASARFEGFTAFPGFETINAVFISDTAQNAAELKPSAPEISLK